MEKKLLLIINPSAGQKKGKKHLADIVRLYNGAGYDCTTYVTGCQGDARRYLKENVKTGDYERIICVGGDGTLNETVSGLAQGGIYCPVGYIPAGSTNDYAHTLNLSTDIMQAAKDTIEGVVFEFDLGRFDCRHFIYTASCGAFAKASYSTNQTAKNMLGYLAYVFEGLKDIPNIKPIHITVEMEDETVEGDYLFCGITNTVTYGGIFKLDKERIRLNDGLFEVMLVKTPANVAQFTQIAMALHNQDMPSEMIDFFTAKKMIITTDREMEWTLDGERGETGTQFNVENLHRRIELVLPERAMGNVPAECPQLPAVEEAEEEDAED